MNHQAAAAGMYARPIVGRELFTRNMDVSSDRWSQQLDGSQDWPSQIFTSQDSSQRFSAPPYRPPQVMMNSSQGSSSGRSMVGPPGGRSNPQGPYAPGVELRDLTLARDIRFGLHTILSVIRDLPEQLKEVSSEVSRASQEPELTRKLITDTSDNLQVLVSGLQDKLAHLVHNKENAEDVLQSLSQREEQILLLVDKVQELSNECKRQDQAKVVTLLRQTRKDCRQELKKMSAAVEEMKRVEPAVRSLQSDVSKMGETVRTCMEELHTSLINQLPPSDPQADFLISAQQSLDQVQATVKNLVEKISSLPKDVAMQVGQVMREIVHSGISTCAGSNSSSSTSFVSPGHRAFCVQRPMFPLAESTYRCQISPVAHVSPLAQVSPQVSSVPPSVCHAQPTEVRSTSSHPKPTPLPTPRAPLKVDPKEMPQSCPAPSNWESNIALSSWPAASQDSNSKAAPQPKPATTGNIELKRMVQGVTTTKEVKNTGVKFQLNKCTEGTSVGTEIDVNKDCCAVLAEREVENVGCTSSRLEQDGTQHFTPQKTYTFIQLTSQSPGQGTLVLDCDSSSSDDSPVMLSSASAALTTSSAVTCTDDWVESQGGIKWPTTGMTAEVKQCNSQVAATPFISSQAAGATVKREVVTPNIRKTPTKVIGDQIWDSIPKSFRMRDDRGRGASAEGDATKADGVGVKDEMIEDKNSIVKPCCPELYKELHQHPFIAPAGPGYIRKRKPDNSYPQESKGTRVPQDEAVEMASMTCRARRYLTPQIGGSLKLMILQGNKKVTRDT
ncbi:uncharacterized protein [Panulirus ornatus]|uniref:uncharacterized protein n=1 Tax=Panulirus ornatus TaxID=150431 RepID=UPI003A8C176B